MSEPPSPLAPVLERVGAGTERLYHALMAASGAWSARVSRLVPNAGDRALVVAPHPDDECAGCAGTLLVHAAAGHETRVVLVTDGGRSRSLNLGEAAMAERRRGEAAAAAELVGASLVRLGLRERELDVEELSGALREALEAFDPSVVYAPSRIDYHPDHVHVARALGRAIAGLPVRVRVYQVHVPLARPLVNLVADVTSHAGTIEAALLAHGSQWESLERTLRLRRYAAARHGIDGLAEEFREMSAAGYAAAHAADRPVPPAPFRGFRYRPFGDPLAYLRGRGARRAFLRAARSRP